MSFSSSERRRLAELFHRVGPDHNTLCEGWTTRDLAAHLYVREHYPLAAAGVMVPALENRLEEAMEAQAARDFDELVDAWAAGPPRFSPFALLDSKANFAEHFVHHEDVRRGEGEIEPRDFSTVVRKQMRATLAAMAPGMLRGASRPVVLTPAGLSPITVAEKRGVSEKGDDVIRVSGEVGELLLWVFGRDAVQVEIDGDAAELGRSGL